MRLWIVRHGKAQQSSPSGGDYDRPLLPRGESQSRWLGQTIAAKKKHPDLILSSGLTRAISTARLIQESLNCPLEIDKRLETGRNVSDVLDLMNHFAPRGRLMLVGHNPTLGELVWTLQNGLPPREAELRTGQADIFEFEDSIAPGKGRVHKILRMDDDE